MKRILFLLAALLTVQVVAQCDGRYESEIFSTVSVTEVEYTDVYDWGPFNSGLDMDVYTPDGDTYSERPLIIFAHGGSFYAGDKNNPAMVSLCESFAKRGVCNSFYSIQVNFYLEFDRLYAYVTNCNEWYF